MYLTVQKMGVTSSDLAEPVGFELETVHPFLSETIKYIAFRL